MKDSNRGKYPVVMLMLLSVADAIGTVAPCLPDFLREAGYAHRRNVVRSTLRGVGAQSPVSTAAGDSCSILRKKDSTDCRALV